MTKIGCNVYQARALEAFSALAERLGAEGEAITIDRALVYQFPLRHDPDVNGAFFVVEPEAGNVLLYLTLPRRVDDSDVNKATEFVARIGYGRRFGALELDLDQGALRVRVDIDASMEELQEKTAHLLERALALAREVSPGWQAICGGMPVETNIVRRYRFV